MKHILLTAVLLCTAVAAQAQGIANPRPLSLPADTDISALKSTGKVAIAELMAAFAANDAASGSKSYIILPLPRDVDQGYFTLQFENAFTQKAGAAGYKLYTRTDSVLANVLKETEFQQNYEDALDKSTIQKLAFIGAQAVVVPRMDIDRSADGTVTLRASISVHNVATAEKVWGDETSKDMPRGLTTQDWIFRGGIAVGAIIGLLVLLWIIGSVRSAARPR